MTTTQLYYRIQLCCRNLFSQIGWQPRFSEVVQRSTFLAAADTAILGVKVERGRLVAALHVAANSDFNLQLHQLVGGSRKLRVGS
ncbi:hypothetical protein [Nostoc sp.]|uniref:hypothetical protein n=1 Tax=Nostoc sp. TaxID=1180 RepID=UPI002FFC4835